MYKIFLIFALAIVVPIALFSAPSDSTTPDPNSVITPFSSISQIMSLKSMSPAAPKRTYVTIIGISGEENLDYKTQEFTHFEINSIPQDMQLKQNLSVIQYDLLLTGWLNSVYVNKFRNDVWSLKYFSRGLAEYAYSYDGHVTKDFYNQMIGRYNHYLEVDNEIEKINTTTDIKYSLAKLFATGCVYSGNVTSSDEAIDKISKIPADSTLYYMQEQAGELYEEGDFSDTESSSKTDTVIDENKKNLGYYVGYEHGENLYYICLAYYPQFKDMKKSAQVKLLDDIYSYNPTLMLAPPIKRGIYAWDHFLDYFWPEKNPEVMKYCLKAYCNWVILPKNI